MKRRSWKVWVAGIALVLLLGAGAGAALFWSVPSKAEQLAARLRVGMTGLEVNEVLLDQQYYLEADPFALRYDQDDGSELYVEWDVQDAWPSKVTAIRPTPLPTDPPLTRLRRTLARAFPFLAE
jgi:hypothetical protein